MEVTNEQANGARKNDGNKPRLGLIYPALLIQTAHVLADGDAEYGVGNWKGLLLSRVIDAMDRHLLAIKSGEDIDPKSRKPHYAHIASGCSFLAWFHENGVLGTAQDDRPFRRDDYKAPGPLPGGGRLAGTDTLESLQAEIVEWADKAIGTQRTYSNAIAKLVLHELPELLMSPESPGEWADVMLLVLDLAYLAKIDMAGALRDKLEILKTRTYARGNDGLYQHVPEGVRIPAEVMATMLTTVSPTASGIDRPSFSPEEYAVRHGYGPHGIALFDKVRLVSDGRTHDEIWEVKAFEHRHEEFGEVTYVVIQNEKFRTTTKLAELVPA